MALLAAPHGRQPRDARPSNRKPIAGSWGIQGRHPIWRLRAEFTDNSPSSSSVSTSPAVTTQASKRAHAKPTPKLSHSERHCSPCHRNQGQITKQKPRKKSPFCRKGQFQRVETIDLGGKGRFRGVETKTGNNTPEHTKGPRPRPEGRVAGTRWFTL